MKLISTFLLTIISGMVAMAQSADGVNFEPQNLPLNIEGKADAYSWLSRDGLRIYFTRDNSSDEIMKAERKSLAEEFKNPESVEISGMNGDYNIFSCWLSEDEKTLFFISYKSEGSFSTSLYKATYDATRKEFINPVKINLTGGEITATSNIFISGPSLTFDFKQLFVYYNDEHTDERIACFTSSDGINYTFKSFLNNAKNYCPGSLSGDGLSFYLTLRNENNLLVKLTRDNLNSEFGSPVYLRIDSSINSGKNYYQPYVNTELGIISVTYGLGTWESNNLAIIKLPTEKTIFEEKVDWAINEIDSSETIEITDDGETIEENVSTDTTLAFVWNFEDNTTVSDSFTTFGPWFCNFGYGDSTEVILVESSAEDTLTFDPNDNFVTPVSNIHTSYFNAMPNPASSYFRIVYNIKTNSTEKPIFEMTNLNGQVVKRFELESTSGNFEIDINGLAEGLYLYKIFTSDFASPVKKLVVKR